AAAGSPGPDARTQTLGPSHSDPATRTQPLGRSRFAGPFISGRVLSDQEGGQAGRATSRWTVDAPAPRSRCTPTEPLRELGRTRKRVRLGISTSTCREYPPGTTIPLRHDDLTLQGTVAMSLP